MAEVDGKRSARRAALRPMLGAGLFTMVLMLLACEPAAEPPLADYVQRISRASGQRAAELPVTAIPLYPRPRDRSVERLDLRGNWLDLLRLRRCGVGPLIAERNSILARTQPASLALHYELRMLKGLEACEAQFARQNAQGASIDAADRALWLQVQGLIELKRANLAAVWWWLSYDTPESAALFSLAGLPLAPGEQAPFSQARAGVETLLGIRPLLAAPGTAQLDVSALEHAQQQLAQSAFGGRWLLSAQRLIEALERGSALLEAAAAQPICPQQRPTPRARILHTVFLRHYVEQVQPYLAQIDQQGRVWLELQQRLLTSQQLPLPEAFAQWSTRTLGRGKGSVSAELDTARLRHVRAWQALLGQCALMPEAPRSLSESRTSAAEVAARAKPVASLVKQDPPFSLTAPGFRPTGPLPRDEASVRQLARRSGRDEG